MLVIIVGLETSEWIKFMLCLDFGLCFDCFKDEHNKLNYYGNVNHPHSTNIYSTCLQNFNEA
jgi:hypothetical protein